MKLLSMLMTLGCALGLTLQSSSAMATKQLIEDDLSILEVTLPKTSFHLGEWYRYTITTRNTFTDLSDKRLFMEVYVSDDMTISSDDAYFTSPMDDFDIIPNGIHTQDIPDRIRPYPELVGSKYLIFKVDVDDRIAERAEWNNTYVLPVTITEGPSDMELVSMSAPSTVTDSQNFTVDISWIHNGGESTQSPFTEFYLSTDANYSSDDLYLGWITDFVMQENVEKFHSTSLNIKSQNPNFNWPNGNYYLIGVAQYFTGLGVEQNQSNNIKAQPIYVMRQSFMF